MTAMRLWRGLFIFLCVLFLAGAPAVSAQTSLESACESLISADFSNLPDAPTRILKSEVVPVAAERPAHCLVSGNIAPTVGFTLAMPLSGWNGKYFQHGCGGSCGTSRLFYCDEPLNRGYACITTDMGHSGPPREWMWAYENLQAQVDFGFRSTHVTLIAGKAIVKAFYNSAPNRAYFYGCSTGGRQAMVEAQHFPWDFDGIIVGAPVINQTGAGLQILWTHLANRDKNGQEILKARDARLMHAAVLKQCDMNDGLKDGLIGDPRRCPFDPASLQCTAANSGQCLSAPQIDAARKIYSGPQSSEGKALYTGGLVPGSELAWIGDFVAADGKSPAPINADFMRFISLGSFNGHHWKPEQFDFDRDYQRFGLVEPLFSGSNPDLRKFKARGGKMIGFQGWNDQSIVPLNFLDYYQTVVRTMGGLEKTQDFYRLFMIPGMRHCIFDGMSGGADAINFLDYLEKWVEKGEVPEAMIGSHVLRDAPLTRALTFPLPADKIDFTRPHYPYPAQYRYKGRGDANDAANFEKSVVNVPAI